jgi:hypothetical protein
VKNQNNTDQKESNNYATSDRGIESADQDEFKAISRRTPVIPGQSSIGKKKIVTFVRSPRKRLNSEPVRDATKSDSEVLGKKAKKQLTK